MLLDSNPHLLSSKASLLSIWLSRNCDYHSDKQLYHNLNRTFTKIPKIQWKVIEFSYVSGQC